MPASLIRFSSLWQSRCISASVGDEILKFLHDDDRGLHRKNSRFERGFHSPARRADRQTKEIGLAEVPENRGTPATDDDNPRATGQIAGRAKFRKKAVKMKLGGRPAPVPAGGVHE